MVQTLTTRSFRNRIGRSHALVESSHDISPELAAKIELARKEYREGKGVTCRTPEEIEAFVNAL